MRVAGDIMQDAVVNQTRIADLEKLAAYWKERANRRMIGYRGSLIFSFRTQRTIMV